MKIEIVEPQDGYTGVTLHKSGSRVLVWCDCHVGDGCPQGKRGSAPRCQIWMERAHLTDKAIETTKAVNRFSR